MKNPDDRILRLPTNKTGRDFVLGDLHGTTDLLRALMEYVAFDPDKDRIFSVGDLIDRGEDSPGGLALLLEPWFHAVLGNHEDMMMDYLLPWTRQKYPMESANPMPCHGDVLAEIADECFPYEAENLFPEEEEREDVPDSAQSRI
jgi:hypothetical protein